MSKTKDLLAELTEMIEEVVSPPAGGKTQWIQNFIKETVKDKLNQYSQQEPICPRNTCTGCPDERVCEDYDIKEGE